MIQKRRVHDMNWFYKHCILDACDHYILPSNPCIMVSEKLKFAGKIVIWNSDENIIKEDKGEWHWDEWMFEPEIVKEGE